MTEEDKKEIAKYMGCQYDDDAGLYFYDNEDEGEVDIFKFDLNDASLCVQEMQKRVEWEEFHEFLANKYEEKCLEWSESTAWLFVAENFFGAMAAWLKEGKK